MKANIQFLAVLLLLSLTSSVFGQEKQPTISRFGGAVTATNNGISLLPSFSLGKPAVMFDMLAGGKRLSFEPQLRFAMEGKPWSFIFWWRYRLVQGDKFKVGIGAHPAIIFRPTSMIINGVATDNLVAQRYLATEVAPNYFIRKNISVGMYYLYSRGLPESATRTTHFVALNANFSSIPLSSQLIFKFNPQVFYLRMDDREGTYVSATLGLAKKDFPVALQSIMSKAISTTIVSKSFVWNVSLIWTFRHDYVRQ